MYMRPVTAKNHARVVHVRFNCFFCSDEHSISVATRHHSHTAIPDWLHLCTWFTSRSDVSDWNRSCPNRFYTAHRLRWEAKSIVWWFGQNTPVNVAGDFCAVTERCLVEDWSTPSSERWLRMASPMRPCLWCHYRMATLLMWQQRKNTPWVFIVQHAIQPSSIICTD